MIGISSVASLLILQTAPAVQATLAIIPGTRVRVEVLSDPSTRSLPPFYQQGYWVAGNLISLDADTLVLKRMLSPPLAIPLSSVTKVEVSQLRGREKSALIGGGVGFMISWGLGFVVTSKTIDFDPLVGKKSVSAMIAVVGALDGVLIGAGGKSKGAGIGFLVGGVFGSFYGMAGHPGLPHFGDTSPEMEHIPTFAIAGAICGAIMSPREQWQQVSMPLRVGLSPRGDGYVAVEFQFGK